MLTTSAASDGGVFIGIAGRSGAHHVVELGCVPHWVLGVRNHTSSKKPLGWRPSILVEAIAIVGTVQLELDHQMCGSGNR